MKIFVPIKDSSQRVFRKNFRIFNAEPLYKHSLLKYHDSEVYVDTDSEEVLHQLERDIRFSNVTVFKRNPDLLGHEVSVCDLIKNFITEYDIIDPIVQLHVTSPFLDANLIKEAYKHMENHDSVVSCNSYQSRFWRKEDYGFCPINHNPLKLEQTQDLPVVYEENSAFYIFEPSVIMSTGARVGKNPYFYPISKPHNMDIDTEEDWGLALKEVKRSKI